MSECKVCGSETNVVVNIRLKKTPVCDPCCAAITKQTVVWLTDRLQQRLDLLNGEIAPGKRWCDECGRHVESHEFRQVEQDEVCRQLCHRHFQE